MQMTLLKRASTEFEIVDAFRASDVFNWVYEFHLPLFSDSECAITVVCKITKYYKDTSEQSRKEGPKFTENDKPIVFLQGGPGFASYLPLGSSSVPFQKALLDRNYTLINIDQRGTGMSTPVNAASLERLGRELGFGAVDDDAFVAQYVDLVSCFRADHIVKDCERIREILGVKKWSIFGQSFGGFCCNTYISMYPDSLNEAFITGGIPGIGCSATQIYKFTFKQTMQRNMHYYTKYPGDVARVKRIVRYILINNNQVQLPDGGYLDVERFQLLGKEFGMNGGTDALHALILQLDHEITTMGSLSYGTLFNLSSRQSFDTNVMYALLQEAEYLDGPGQVSNWAADRTRSAYQDFLFVEGREALGSDWVENERPFYFLGELVLKSMYSSFVELRKLKKVAFGLHAHSNFSHLYNKENLGKIYPSMSCYKQRILHCDKSLPKSRVTAEDVKLVKVVAALYTEDQYVPLELSLQTINNYYGHVGTYKTSEYFHNGIRSGTAAVINNLFALLDSDAD